MAAETAIREYREEDGLACWELRRAAFRGPFRPYLDEERAAAGAESYGVQEFACRLHELETSVASEDDTVVGFCAMRRISAQRVELLYLYVHAEHQGRGVGTRLVRHAEACTVRRHRALKSIYLDTAIPAYNQAFWEAMGYRPVGPSFCEYPTGKIPAVRLEKRMEDLE